MENHSLPSLAFRIAPTSLDAVVGLAVHSPGHESGPVLGKANLLPFAAAMVCLKIEAMRQPRVATIAIEERHFGSAAAMFHKSWNFLKNVMRSDPEVKAASLLKELRPWLEPGQRQGKAIIQLYSDRLPYQNISFNIIDRGSNQHTPYTEQELMALFEFLAGRLPAENLLAGIGSEPSAVNIFRFADKPTGTTVVQAFPHGLSPEYITCTLIGENFEVPTDINVLIDLAHTVFKENAAEILAVRDKDMLAPKRVEISMADLDSGMLNVAFAYTNSSYRHYAAFAFAELLANYSNQFQPLLDFVRNVPNPRQPSPATSSMGVRVLLETNDNRLIAAHRSNRVKLNPNVWSVSANEGVRRQLLEPGRDCSDLLAVAVYRAVKNELRVEERECQQPVLLSIYRNSYNQWGAGFAMKTDLSSRDVIARQVAATHSFEYRNLAALPLNVEDCGRAMCDLGERWYGGALETICQFFSWQCIAEGRYLDSQQIAGMLNESAGRVIIPVDQANPALLPTRQ